MPNLWQKKIKKAIINRSRPRNKYLKFLSREGFVIMKKMKNKCRISKIKYLKRSTEKGISSSKQFWNFVEPFLTNKGWNVDAFIDKVN